MWTKEGWFPPQLAHEGWNDVLHRSVGASKVVNQACSAVMEFCVVKGDQQLLPRSTEIVSKDKQAGN